uniref:Uncharacterized protein n=1 Tax=Anguilla anguilla TaxID=7936 RepID=A0A0E9VZU4_ANGAN
MHCAIECAHVQSQLKHFLLYYYNTMYCRKRGTVCVSLINSN